MNTSTVDVTGGAVDAAATTFARPATGEHATAVAAAGQQYDGRLRTAFTSDRIWNGVTITPEGRIFVAYPQADRPGWQVAELGADGRARPYPDLAWNADRGPVDSRFVHINALRIGPDGALWLVDAGGAGPGKPAVAGGARLFRVDVARNQVARAYTLSAAADSMTYVDDMRFHGSMAYLTDAGKPGLIVLDLTTGATRRVLDGHASTTQRRALMADGKPMLDENGHSPQVHADQLEVSNDGKFLYFQPCSGPMSRIETCWLDDPAVPDAELARHVEPFADTPTTGGTAIDARGDLYVSDAVNRRVLRITPDGAVSTLIADPRLAWVDAMWIDSAGVLWMPAAQLHLVPAYNGGRFGVQYPVSLYTMSIGVGPPDGDHR